MSANRFILRMMNFWVPRARSTSVCGPRQAHGLRSCGAEDMTAICSNDAIVFLAGLNNRAQR